MVQDFQLPYTETRAGYSRHFASSQSGGSFQLPHARAGCSRYHGFFIHGVTSCSRVRETVQLDSLMDILEMQTDVIVGFVGIRRVAASGQWRDGW